MALVPSRVGFLEHIRMADDESASPTNGYLIAASAFNVSLRQNANFKDYSEKGIDTTVYTLSGTQVEATLSAPLKTEEVGIYKLLDKVFSQFNERTSVSPTTFSIHSSYYGTLHGCVVKGVTIESKGTGPIDVSFDIAARYLDFSTRATQQLDSYLDLPLGRVLTFYDAKVTMSPSYANFNLPELEDFSSYMQDFSISISNNVQVNWTLAEQDDISDTLSPQNLLAPKDITIGGREISGSIGYIMSYNELFGFYKVLQNTTSLNFAVYDALGLPAPALMEISINNPVFLPPNRPNNIGVLQQVIEFRGVRSEESATYHDAVAYSYNV